MRGHLVADVVSLGIAVAGVVVLSRPTGRRHSFGFARAEVLAWNLASDVSACSAHVVLAGRPTLFQAQQAAELVKADLADRFGLIHVTLELEDLSFIESSLVAATDSQNSATKEH